MAILLVAAFLVAAAATWAMLRSKAPLPVASGPAAAQDSDDD
jgi:hypothetical protein